MAQPPSVLGILGVLRRNYITDINVLNLLVFHHTTLRGSRRLHIPRY